MKSKQRNIVLMVIDMSTQLWTSLTPLPSLNQSTRVTTDSLFRTRRQSLLPCSWITPSYALTYHPSPKIPINEVVCIFPKGLPALQQMLMGKSSSFKSGSLLSLFSSWILSASLVLGFPSSSNVYISPRKLLTFVLEWVLLKAFIAWYWHSYQSYSWSAVFLHQQISKLW